MLILQSSRFRKVYKKLNTNQKTDVDKAIIEVSKNPNIGEQKTGDLSWLRVYKFRMLGQLTLLGYSVDNKGKIILTLVDVGPHENFYRDLKYSS